MKNTQDHELPWMMQPLQKITVRWFLLLHTVFTCTIALYIARSKVQLPLFTSHVGVVYACNFQQLIDMQQHRKELDITTKVHGVWGNVIALQWLISSGLALGDYFWKNHALGQAGLLEMLICWLEDAILSTFVMFMTNRRSSSVFDGQIVQICLLRKSYTRIQFQEK